MKVKNSKVLKMNLGTSKSIGQKSQRRKPTSALPIVEVENGVPCVSRPPRNFERRPARGTKNTNQVRAAGICKASRGRRTPRARTCEDGDGETNENEMKRIFFIDCLVCLQINDTEVTYVPTSGSKSGGHHRDVSLSVQVHSSANCAEKLTLLEFCNLLKIRVPPPQKGGASFQSIEAPLCTSCATEVAKIKSLLNQIDELQHSLETTRGLVKELLKANSDHNHFAPDKDASELSSVLNAINSVRKFVKKELSDHSSSKFSTNLKSNASGVRRKQRKKLEKLPSTAKLETIATEEPRRSSVTKIVSGPEPAATSEVPLSRSSFGRVVKRPRFYISDDSRDPSDDIVEKKFDPSHSQPNLHLITTLKVECSNSNASVGDDLPSPDPGEQLGAHNYVNMKVGSPDDLEEENTEIELKLNKSETEHTLSDSNWSPSASAVGAMQDEINKNCLKNKRKGTKRKPTLKSRKTISTKKLVHAGVKKLAKTAIKKEKIETKPKKAAIRTHRKTNIECEKCTRNFSDSGKMERHKLRVHEGKNSYECKSCKKVFTSMKDILQHRKLEHPTSKDKHYKLNEDGRRKFECEYCQAVFKHNGDLHIHRRHHTGERPFKCGTCKEAFISKGRREVHVEVAHPEQAPLQCEFCPRSFFRHHRLRDHMQSHTGERPYLCEICSKSFSQPAYLKYHQTKHKELNLHEFKCNECERMFASPINLKLHKETQHQKKYRFHCEICGHGATHMSHLKLHMRSHTGERPHTCSHCNKSFARSSQLKIHVRSHTGERPYLCTTCPKAFTNSSKLRRHELIHAGAKRNQRILKVSPNLQPTDGELGVESSDQAVSIDANSEDKTLVKVEHLQHASEGNEPDIQQQLITIEQANGVTYQVIATNDVTTEPYTEYIVLDGDFNNLIG